MSKKKYSFEVLLSVLKLSKKDLLKMNITSPCTVINQCGKDGYEEYHNFHIYSYDELGVSNSRNRGLEHVHSDIIALCDDDVVYCDDYQRMILEEFKKYPDADIIVFNIDSPYRPTKMNKKSKRLHIFNILKYASSRIVFKRESIQQNAISFRCEFGPGSKYTCGEDTLFLVDSLNKGLKIYSSTINIGTVNHIHSNWFHGYDEKYFFDKGALFTAISYPFRYFLFLQYLIRHREILDKISFWKAYKIMKEGSKDYLDYIK